VRIPNYHARKRPMTGIKVEGLQPPPDCVDGWDAQRNHVGDGPHETVGDLTSRARVGRVCRLGGRKGVSGGQWRSTCQCMVRSS